jgi:hypothetical protein
MTVPEPLFRIAVNDFYQFLAHFVHDGNEFFFAWADVRYHLGVFNRVGGGRRAGIQ